MPWAHNGKTVRISHPLKNIKWRDLKGFYNVYVCMGRWQWEIAMLYIYQIVTKQLAGGQRNVIFNDFYASLQKRWGVWRLEMMELCTGSKRENEALWKTSTWMEKWDVGLLKHIFLIFYSNNSAVKILLAVFVSFQIKNRNQKNICVQYRW